MSTRMDRLRKAAMAFLPGIAVSHIFFSFFVYQSNLALYRRLLAVADAGYLTVPNAAIMSTLPDFFPAFFGALFFTFSLGISLSLLTFAALWLRRQSGEGGRRRRMFAVFFMGLLMGWVGSVFLLAVNGVHPIITSWLIVIPVVITASSRNWRSQRHGQGGSTPDIWLVTAGAVFLFGQCLIENPTTSIINIRDRLLLSTETGSVINDFYYRYTLYPAEAMKAQHQKQIKTCQIDAELTSPLRDRLLHALAKNDYLVVPKGIPSDLVLRSGDGGGLILFNATRAILVTSAERFFSDVGSVLREFSTRSDGYRLFRKYAAVGLMISHVSIPVFFLEGVLTILRTLLKRKPLVSFRVAMLCMACAVLFLILQGSYHAACHLPAEPITELLASERTNDHISGLKTLLQQGDEITCYSEYRLPGNLSPVAERYWALKAFAKSKNATAYQAIFNFKDDPHPNVQCVFLEALGRLGSKKDTHLIIEKIETSTNWYVQWYAYRSLKDLGWQQERSTSKP